MGCQREERDSHVGGVREREEGIVTRAGLEGRGMVTQVGCQRGKRHRVTLKFLKKISPFQISFYSLNLITSNGNQHQADILSHISVQSFAMGIVDCGKKETLLKTTKRVLTEAYFRVPLL